MFYPKESYNNKVRAEMRWEDDANIYGDISSEWKISLGNGKRLGRKWRRKGGLAFINAEHGVRTIYNEAYDVELQKAMYDRSVQPYGDDFYTSVDGTVRSWSKQLHDKEIAYIRQQY